MFAPYFIAFGLFFYVCMHNDFEETNEMSSKLQKNNYTDLKEEIRDIVKQNTESMKKAKEEVLNEIDKKGDFFDKVGFSVMKTMAMFLGEVEFSDIPFDSIPYFNHTFIVIFVFFIVIVLMNLLTGLAV